MKKIKVYNLKSYVENQEIEGKKYSLFDFTKGISILEGRNGIINFDDEGVGFNLKDINDSFKIGLTDIPEQGHLFVMPQYQIKITCKDIIDNCKYEEMESTEFIKKYKYNSRMKNNFNNLLRAIDGMGLNSRDYYNGEML